MHMVFGAGVALVRRRSRFLLFCVVGLASFFLGALVAAATSPPPLLTATQGGDTARPIGVGGGAGGFPLTNTPTMAAGSPGNNPAGPPTAAIGLQASPPVMVAA